MDYEELYSDFQIALDRELSWLNELREHAKKKALEFSESFEIICCESN